MNSANHREIGGLYRFGGFTLHVAERTLVREGERIPLPPKAVDTLIVLVENSGRLVTKESLIQSVWPDSFVEENNLNQYISLLRKSLGKDSAGSQYIETIPRRGYRFLSNVERSEEFSGSEVFEMVVARHSQTSIVIEEQEITEEVGDSDVATPAQTAVIPLPTAKPTIFTKRRLAAGVAACVLLAGGILITELRTHQRSPAGEQGAPPLSSVVAPNRVRTSVVLLGFRDLSGQKQQGWLASALAEMLTTELASSTQIRIVSGEEAQRIKSDLHVEQGQLLSPATLAQIRTRSGADVVVSGSIVELDSRASIPIRLDLRLQDTRSTESDVTFSASGSISELFSLVSRSGAELLSRLGVTRISETEALQAQAAMPATPQVARLYAEGMARLRMFDAPEAEKLLAKAVDLDPSFALGHSALASAWSTLGYDERARKQAQKALDVSVNLSPRVRQLIAGQVNESARNWDQAVTAYRQLLDSDPENVDYAIKLANALINNSRGQDALQILDQMRKLPDPIRQEPRIDLACSEAAASLGQFRLSLDCAEHAIQRGTELNEKTIVARAELRKAWATHRLGLEDPLPGLQEARKVFAQSGDQQGVATALKTAATIQSEHGDTSAAMNSYEQAIAIFERVGDRRSLGMATNGLATLFYNRGELEKAKTLYEKYLALEREVDSKVNTAGALGNIANIEDARGNLREAIRLNDESIRIFTEAGDQRALATATNNSAILLYELGELDAAAKKFTAAAEIARKIGYQRGVAYDLSGLGDVQRAKGNLDQALGRYREALGIRNQLGEKHNAAVSRLSLALIELDKNNPAGADDSVAEIAEEFQKDQTGSDEASAREIQARIFIAQQKFAQASAALNRAHLLAKASPGLPLELDIALTSIQLDLTTHHNIASLSNEISRLLVTVQKSGYREYSYKVRLLGAEFDIAHGRVQQGRSQIKLIAQDSKANGFGLIAQKANHRLHELDQ